MCLIITACAAAITAALYFTKYSDEKYNLLMLVLMYLSASLMWSVDGIFSVIGGESFFDMSANDALLGLLVVVAGAALWAVTLIINKVKKQA
ncbi:MAG: hypothetical protein K5656_11900 [Lachnospiraceae bacterium]|nr:hypothetical protein [Lachnospiraceae bacterium]